MTPPIRLWCPQLDAHRLQAGLGLASLLMGDSLTSRRSTIPAGDVAAAVDGVSISAPGHWSAPLAQRVFDGGDRGVVVAYEDGTAFHLVPSGRRGARRSWRATDALFVGPEAAGACPGWTDTDAAQVFAMAHPHMATARLREPSGNRADYWTSAPTVLEQAMPALAKARPHDLVAAREQELADVARLVLGDFHIDLVFVELTHVDHAVAAVDLMGTGMASADSIAAAKQMHDPDVLAALGRVATRLFPGRLGRCRVPASHETRLLCQGFARLRVEHMMRPLSAHGRMAILERVYTRHPEILPFVSRWS